MRTAFVHSVYIDLPTALEFIVYLTNVFHTDGMNMDEKLSTHRNYKSGKQVSITVSVVSASSERLLLKSSMGTSIKDLQPYMLFN